MARWEEEQYRELWPEDRRIWGGYRGGNHPYLSPPPPPAVPDPDSSRREDGGGHGSWVAPARTVPRLRKLLPSVSMERRVDATLRTRTGGLRRAGLPLASPGQQCGRSKGGRVTWRNGQEGTPTWVRRSFHFVHQFTDPVHRLPSPQNFLTAPSKYSLLFFVSTLLFTTHCF